jgi:gliding motility-associated-like protein
MFGSGHIPFKLILLPLLLGIQIPLHGADFFVANKGQWHPKADYLFRTGKKDIWITKNGLRTNIYDLKGRTNTNIELAQNTPIHYEVFDLLFLHANTDINYLEISPHEYPIHYIQQDNVITSCAAESILGKQLYQNIDVRYYLNKNKEFEYDFIIHPGGNPSKIQMQISGLKNYSIDSLGNLILQSELFNNLIIQHPIAYQIIQEKKMIVPVQYKINQGVIEFELGKYNKKYDLIIDPSLKYSTFLFCSNCEDLAADNDINSAGEVVVTGYTLSTSFPTTLGAFQTTLGNANFIHYDAYVTKLNAAGTNLIFSTFIGGNAQDIAYSVSYDNANNILITGKTASTNFPRFNALNNTNQGGSDAFVTKLNPSGNALIFSTFIGGNSFDEGKSICVDKNNAIYIIGNTLSSNLPATAGAIKNSLSPPLSGVSYQDGFYCKLNPTGTAVNHFTYLGGNDNDYFKQIKVDSLGCAYIVGNTSSSNFHVVNAYDNTFNGDIDGFVMKVNPTATGFVFSTFLGGNLKDYVQAIAIDRHKNIYVSGNTYSSNHPVISPNFKSTPSNSGSEIFVSCFDSSGTNMKHATYIGSGFLNGLALNDCGYVFLSGFSFDPNYPITADALQNTITGIDNIVTVIDSSLRYLAFSSFLGGNESDYGAAKISLLNNVFYYSGTTLSMNFPTTAGSFQTVKSHLNPTPFVSAIQNMCFLPDPKNITISPNSFCLNQPVNATLKAKPVSNLCSSNNLSIYWYKNKNRLAPIAIGDSVNLLINPLDSYYVVAYDNTYQCKSREIKLVTNTSNIVYNRNYIRCKGDSMYLGKAWRKQSGSWFDTIASAPCDSIIKSTLTITAPPYKKITLDKCKGTPFVLNSKVYTVNGTYIDTLKTPQGCDSIIEFTLNFIETSRVDTIKICIGSTYKVGTKTYNATGVYRDTLISYIGCDSIVVTHLFVTNNKVYFVTKTLCSNQSYTVGSNVYLTSGTYIDTFHLSGSCDSIIVSTLTFIPAIQTLDTVKVCEGDTFLLFGTQKIANLMSSGFQSKQLPNCTTKTTLVIVKPKVYVINVFIKKCDDKGLKVGSKTYFTSGVYIDTLKQINGCDSIIETTLTIIPKPISIVVNYAKNICAGKTFIFNGKLYNSNGTFTDTLRNAGGCDSAYVNLLITVVNNNYKYIDTTLCQGQFIKVGNKIYFAAGTYKDTLQNVFGCDSVIESKITLNPIKNTLRVDTFCQGKSFFFNNAWRSVGGTYYDTLKTYLNCDSFITLQLYMSPTKYTNRLVSICSGKSIFLGGQWRNTPGIYRDTLNTSRGCDSVITSTLSIKNTYVITNNVSICSGNIYSVGNKAYNTTGNYRDTLSTIGGCDSIINTNLTVSAIFYGNRNIARCSGDSFYVQKKFQTLSGIYYDTSKTASNCDSVTITSLTFNPTYRLSLTRHICSGDSALLAGAYQKTNGIYIDNLKTKNNCDSTITTQLIVHPKSAKTNNVFICSNQFYFAQKQNRNTSGIYLDTFKTVFGCDSIVTTYLTVYPTYSRVNKVTLCSGLSYFAGGKLRTSAGIYIDTLKSTKGCDSIVFTDLSFLPSYNFLISKTICRGNKFLFHGTYYDKPGTYLKTYYNIFGCDSNFQLDLSIQKPVSSISYQKICIGDTLLINNKKYFKDGTHFDTLTSFAGCDSIVELKLSYNAIYNTSQVINLCEGDSIKINKTWKYATGYYIDTFESTYGCDSFVLSKIMVDNCDSTLTPLIPSAFSPNGDGVNDLFRPVLPTEKITILRFSIYDRWGSLVFDSDRQSQFYWDGKFNGENVPTGIYLWQVTYKSRGKSLKLEGNVTLLR